MRRKAGDREKKDTGKEGKVRIILLSIIRFILVLAFFAALNGNRSLLLIMSSFAFGLTFVPNLIERIFKITVPAKFEIMIILFIYGILFVAEVRGLFAEFWWWDVVLNSVSAIALGFVGLTVLFVLYNDNKLNANPFVIAIFSFSFAVAIGSVWEIFEFGMDSFFGFGMQKSGLADTMGDLIVNSIGASVVSFVGYFYIKKGKINFVSSIIEKFMKKNPKLFRSKNIIDASEETIRKLIENGEDKHVEFKSTLRTNLHTNNADKKMEHSVLKTIVAYLNSHGGTLLVGVDNEGNITGTNKDNFENNDKLNLHFTNMIKNHIGSEYLPFIKHDLVNVNGEHVLKVDCDKSDNHVFLKLGDLEEFYVRNGPSSVKLSGSSLVDYIRNKFGR